jgi:hypothetical protein
MKATRAITVAHRRGVVAVSRRCIPANRVTRNGLAARGDLLDVEPAPVVVGVPAAGSEVD